MISKYARIPKPGRPLEARVSSNFLVNVSLPDSFADCFAKIDRVQPSAWRRYSEKRGALAL